MSSTPREIGTLIVVVLRAKNLPNKRHIGKQDPYCRMTFNQETRRTKAVKRGGQHPEWDEEVRFSIYDDGEDEPARTEGDKTPPPKDRFRNIKGGKSMRVSCYADDPREPDLIGEAQVDLSEALTKGEVDEWFTLQNKEKYAGEVYLEMTFWSNARAPAKKKAPRPSISNPQYGGPGSFIASSSASVSASAPPPSISTNEIPAFLRPNRETSPTASVPDSLRPSASALGQPDLYISPYNSQNSLASQNSLPSALEPAGPPYDDFGRLGQNTNHRRDSYPSVRYDQPSSLYSHPSNGAIPQPAYQPSPYDPYSASSLAQSMSNMHVGQPPAPSLFSPPTPAPSFAPSQFGYAPPENVPPPFPQGPGYPGLGYGPPSATPMPPNGAFQPGFAPNQGNRLASSGFAGPPPIPTAMPFNVPPSVTPFQQPPNPSQTPFPQQHPYQYPPNPTPAPLLQNGFSAGQFVPFSPQMAPPGHGIFPPQQGPPPPQPTSPPRGALPYGSQQQLNGLQHQSTLPPPPQSQPYLPQQSYTPQPPQNPPPPLQTYNSSGSSRPLPTPQQGQSPSSSANLFGNIPGSFPQSQTSAPSSGSFGPVPGSFPQPSPNTNGQQWHPPASGHRNSLPPAPPSLPGPPPPLPAQPPLRLTTSPDQQNQSPPPKHFQAPPPPPNPSFQMYQNSPETQIPPPPSAYQQPPPPHPHPQHQLQSVPIGGIFPGPSTTTIYPGPPPKPPQMVAPQHNGWQ